MLITYDSFENMKFDTDVEVTCKTYIKNFQSHLELSLVCHFEKMVAKYTPTHL